MLIIRIAILLFCLTLAITAASPSQWRTRVIYQVASLFHNKFSCINLFLICIYNELSSASKQIDFKFSRENDFIKTLSKTVYLL